MNSILNWLVKKGLSEVTLELVLELEISCEKNILGRVQFKTKQ